MALPLSPPLKPQLAKSSRELPQGDGWRYEPKLDGFRTIVFRDGDDVHLQSRNGKPMNRYFPDVVEQVLALDSSRVVLDGEMVVTVDGVQEFDLLSQRIHPAASRVERLAEETPAVLVAFDLLADGRSRCSRCPTRSDASGWLRWWESRWSSPSRLPITTRRPSGWPVPEKE